MPKIEDEITASTSIPPPDAQGPTVETPKPTHRDMATRHPAGRPGIGAARLHRKSGRHTLAPPMSHRDPPQAFVEGVGNALILTWVMWVGIAELAILAL